MGATFANVRGSSPLWCADGPFRDHLLMQQAWAERGGKMAPPRELTLPAMSFKEPQHGYARFMRALDLQESGDWVSLPRADRAFVDDGLFRSIDGKWRWFKRGRDAWALYVAETIRRLQEVWRLKLGGSEELYLMGGFQRGRQELEALVVFKRAGDSGDWLEGKTAYVAEKDDYLNEKRRWLLSRAACIRYLEM